MARQPESEVKRMNIDQKTEKTGMEVRICPEELSDIELYIRLRDSFDSLVIPDCHWPLRKSCHPPCGMIFLWNN